MCRITWNDVYVLQPLARLEIGWGKLVTGVFVYGASGLRELHHPWHAQRLCSCLIEIDPCPSFPPPRPLWFEPPSGPRHHQCATQVRRAFLLAAISSSGLFVCTSHAGQRLV